MAFNHQTIGIAASTNIVNVNYPIENITLTSVGLSLRRQAYATPSLSFKLGLTPPGDEQVEIYEVLLSGILSPGDGMTWTDQSALEIFSTSYSITSQPRTCSLF